MDWAVEGVNYWENPACPTDYLRSALIALAEYVQGVEIPEEQVNSLNREQLCAQIEFLEEVADK